MADKKLFADDGNSELGLQNGLQVVEVEDHTHEKQGILQGDPGETRNPRGRAK